MNVSIAFSSAMGAVVLAGVVALSPAVVASAPSATCQDLDGDGYVAGSGCAVQEDCNDQNAAVHPGATEVCNGWDDNCDGVIDEGCATTCPNFGMTRRVLVTHGGSEARIAAADRSWVMVVNSDFPSYPEVATRLDLRGQPLSPQTVFTGGFPKNQEVCWTGTEMASAWSVFETSGYPPGIFFRRLGPWGVPSSDTVTLSGGVSPFVEGLDWTGYEYGTFWAEATSTFNGEYLSRVSAGGAMVDQVRMDSLVDADDAYAWNGTGYGWVRTIQDPVTLTDDIYFEPLDASGFPVGPLVRLTDHSAFPNPAYAGPAVLVALNSGAGYGVVWDDNRTGTGQLWFAILQPDGTIVTPPGQVQVTHTTRSIAQLFDMTWSGSEFMAVWGNLDNTLSNGLGEIYGTRISAAGDVLETEQITAGPTDIEPRIAWNGKSYGMAVEAQPPATPPDSYFVQIDCNCTTDADGDGVLPCGGGDCDDSDPSVATGKPEICTDGKDNNCDGLVDCNDSTCVQNGSAPAEIANVRFSSGKTTVSWDGDTKATGYDVARGVLSDLRAMQNFRWADCFANRTTATSTTDTEDPKPGTGFYYLVRGRAKTCLLGTWGGSLADGTLHGCP